MKDLDDFCAKFDLVEHTEVFRKGTLLAQNPHSGTFWGSPNHANFQILGVSKERSQSSLQLGQSRTS